MKYCRYCGKPHRDDDKFCGYCGKELGPTGRQAENRHRNSGLLWAALGGAGVLVILLAAVFRIRLIENSAPDYHTEEYGFVRDGDEITYASPTEDEHLRELSDGVADELYADNELIVQLNDTMTERQAQEFARQNGAELVGFISISGTCQWRFPDAYSLASLREKAEELSNTPQIAYALLNYLTEYSTDSSQPEDWEIDVGLLPDQNRINQRLLNDEFPSESGWLKGEGSWGYREIGADRLGEFEGRMKDSIDICIIDSGFQPHYDLNYELTKQAGYSQGFEHGTHVAGIAAAVCDNGVGMRGVYSDPARQAGLYIATWPRKTSIELMNVIAGSIMKGCKVVNMSFGVGNTDTFLRCFQNNDEIDQYVSVYTEILSQLIEHKYQFLLVQSAGNASHRTSDRYYRSMPDAEGNWHISEVDYSDQTWGKVRNINSLNQWL